MVGFFYLDGSCNGVSFCYGVVSHLLLTFWVAQGLDQTSSDFPACSQWQRLLEACDCKEWTGVFAKGVTVQWQWSLLRVLFGIGSKRVLSYVGCYSTLVLKGCCLMSVVRMQTQFEWVPRSVQGLVSCQVKFGYVQGSNGVYRGYPRLEWIPAEAGKIN